MKITQLTKIATDKSKFKTLPDFLDFAEMYLDYVATKLQAVIISQNENHYQFYQYGSDGGYQITRPINSKLMYSVVDFTDAKRSFVEILKSVKDIKSDDDRQAINRLVYTLQMSIGSAL